MSSRDKILSRVKQNQPGKAEGIVHSVVPIAFENVVEKFITILTGIGGKVFQIENIEEVNTYLRNIHPTATQVVSSLEIDKNIFAISPDTDPHSLSEIEIAILKGQFAIAENGAIWITQENMMDRALPFICENLMLIIKKDSIVPTLHEAYAIITDSSYQYGTFIAGPSKTADIEQSLVLGAHGPKTLSVFILK